MKDKEIMDDLEKSSKHPKVRIQNDFLNVYEATVKNLINYNNQFRLINRLLKASIETEGILSRAVLVFKIQIELLKSHKMKEESIQ